MQNLQYNETLQIGFLFWRNKTFFLLPLNVGTKYIYLLWIVKHFPNYKIIKLANFVCESTLEFHAIIFCDDDITSSIGYDFKCIFDRRDLTQL